MQTYASAQESFKTEEYGASGALDLVNAAEAYAQGYTEIGQTIGVLDTPVRVDHPELSGKANLFSITCEGEIIVPDWESEDHGSHVAGIIAAKRDGIGMHGIAFDARLWAGALLNNYGYLDLPTFFTSHPEVRIFNNSWGATEYWPIFNDDGSIISINDYLQEQLLPDFEVLEMIEHAQAHPESVFVFAAGNEGQLSPNFPANIPIFRRDLTSFINVGAINSNPELIQEVGGRKILSAASIPWFTNLAHGAELFTVMAPGSNIYSLDSSNNGYMLDSGTSMAAPVVSGALALVAQAYP